MYDIPVSKGINSFCHKLEDLTFGFIQHIRLVTHHVCMCTQGHVAPIFTHWSQSKTRGKNLERARSSDLICHVKVC